MLSHGNQTDFIIDGVYDNARSQQREFYRDGELKRYVARKCCGIHHPNFGEQRHEWGYYNDLPARRLA